MANHAAGPQTDRPPQAQHPAVANRAAGPQTDRPPQAQHPAVANRAAGPQADRPPQAQRPPMGNVRRPAGGSAATGAASAGPAHDESTAPRAWQRCPRSPRALRIRVTARWTRGRARAAPGYPQPQARAPAQPGGAQPAARPRIRRQPGSARQLRAREMNARGTRPGPVAARSWLADRDERGARSATARDVTKRQCRRLLGADGVGHAVRMPFHRITGRFRWRRASSPRAGTTTGSCVPCARTRRCLIGRRALGRQVRRRAAGSTTVHDAGELVRIAPLRRTAPWHRPGRIPPVTIRSLLMPRAFSRRISASTVACELRIPVWSSGPWRSSATMSYQARMANPPLSVTGRIGACGNTKRSARSPGRTSSGTRGSKSWPSPPRPWSRSRRPRIAAGFDSTASATPATPALFTPVRRMLVHGCPLVHRGLK